MNHAEVQAAAAEKAQEGLSDRMRALLAEAPECAYTRLELLSELGGPAQAVKSSLNYLRDCGHVEATDENPCGSKLKTYRITRAGLRFLSSDKAGSGQVAGPRVHIAGPGKYLGEDLRRAPVRAGAMDAYRLPSVVVGQVVVPRRQAGDTLVGLLLLVAAVVGILLAIHALAPAGEPGQSAVVLTLKRAEWICTDQQLVVLNPPAAECTTYRRLK